MVGSAIRKWKSWRADNRGATAIEYVLIAAGISLAIGVAVFLFGGQVATLYSSLPGVLPD